MAASYNHGGTGSPAASPAPLTWPDCVAKVPKLKDLEDRARSFDPDDPDYCGWRACEALKREFRRLVGWDARNAPPAMRGREAYEVVFRHICYEVLPGCTPCRCNQ